MIMPEAPLGQLSQFRHLNRQMGLLAFNAAAGGFCFGYHLTSMSVALLQAKRPNGGHLDPCPGLATRPLSVVEQQMLTSFITLGGFIGSCLASWLNWHFGRRKVALGASLINAIGAILMASAGNVYSMLVARVVTGLGIGISGHTVPLYVSECAPPHLRGAFCLINTVMMIGGYFSAALVGCGLFWLDTRNGWRWMLGVTVIPAVLMLLGVCLQPESPRWLLSKGRDEEAKRTFAHLHGQGENSEVAALLATSTGNAGATSMETQHGEFAAMVQAIHAEQSCTNSGSVYDTYWRNPCVRRPLLLGCFLMFLNQCVGNNLIAFYGPSLLQRTSGIGFASDSGTCFTHENKLSVTMNLVFPSLHMLGLLSGWFFIESVGRRPLIFISTISVMISLTATGIAFSMPVVSITCVLFCIACHLVAFGIGLSGVPWAVNNEIYPVHVRAQCLSVALAAKWLFGFITSQTYLSLAHALSTSKDDPRKHPDGIFWLYGLVALGAIPVLWRYMVETKGLTLERTSELFMDAKEIFAAQPLKGA